MKDVTEETDVLEELLEHLHAVDTLRHEEGALTEVRGVKSCRSLQLCSSSFTCTAPPSFH